MILKRAGASYETLEGKNVLTGHAAGKEAKSSVFDMNHPLSDVLA